MPLTDKQNQFIMIAAIYTDKELASKLGDNEKLINSLREDYSFPEAYLQSPGAKAVLTRLGNTQASRLLAGHAARFLTSDEGAYPDPGPHRETVESFYV